MKTYSDNNEINYHMSVWMPAAVQSAATAVNAQLSYTQHAKDEALRDRYGCVKYLPSHFIGGEWLIYEAGTIEGRLSKVCARRPLGDGSRDLAMVLRPSLRNDGTWRVITLFINLSGDQHRSLNRANYAKPPKK